MRLFIMLVLITGLAGGTVAFAEQVSVSQMMADNRYWPPPCREDTCILTGLGGITEVWERYIDKNHGRLFIVAGVCASACYKAVLRAMKNGEQVRMIRGSRLVDHEASIARW